ncbi:MAG: CRTAC1 family protein, partial [Acidobacteriota bacterium]
RLGRTESILFDFRRHGGAREIVLGVLLTGTGTGGELRQEGGKLRLRLVREGSAASWRAVAGSVSEWMIASASEPLFEERAAAAGLTRVHRAYLPNAARNIPIPGEHMPPGAAVLDFDGDGRDDLFVASGDGNRLYRNLGDGRFEDVAAKAGVSGQKGEAAGALSFDFDNDGLPDLYVTYIEAPNLLFRNLGNGTFEEIGKKAGVALLDYSSSAAALDYDRDGLPDLYVLVYGPRDRGPNVQANNAPPNHLFHNNGDGTFTDVTKASRTGDTGWALALECADLDGDGWPDIYVANDFGNNSYLHNEGNGTFTNRAGRAGLVDPGFGMGVAIDDVEGKGRLDLYVSNYSFPMNWFLKDPRFPMPEFPYSLGRPLVWRRLTTLSRGSSLFRRRANGTFERLDEAGVSDTSWSWGCVFIDADMDGRPDLFVVNGMVTGKNAREHEIDFWNTMSAGYKNFEKGIPTADFGEDSLWGHPPKRFYRNLDGRRFAELAAVTGLESDANQRGLVLLDVDGDGAPDLFATGFLQPPSLWVNRNPSRAHALVVTVQGDPARPGPYKSTRDGLGALVTVEAGGLKRTQVVAAGSSFLSSSARALYYGLGDAARADSVTILWPSGRKAERRDVPAGRLLLRESDR